MDQSSCYWVTHMLSCDKNYIQWGSVTTNFFRRVWVMVWVRLGILRVRVKVKYFDGLKTAVFWHTSNQVGNFRIWGAANYLTGPNRTVTILHWTPQWTSQHPGTVSDPDNLDTGLRLTYRTVADCTGPLWHRSTMWVCSGHGVASTMQGCHR